MHMEDEVWNNNLSDPNSNEFIELAENITLAVRQNFSLVFLSL